MLDSSRETQRGILSNALKQALLTLLEAFDLAVDSESDHWDFATSIRHLQEFGVSETHLRWLIRKGYADHAREVTVQGDDGRVFRSAGRLTFTRRSCFVLTEAGVAKARSLSMPPTKLPTKSPKAPDGNGQAAREPVVHWDSEARKLRLNGKLVKRFKWPAVNQEAILNVFQEEGWPSRIDDPLPPHPEQDSKRRLSDTIKCLNRKQANPLIHFCGDGTGEGVIWELINEASNANGVE